jgi:hypothetical protein
MHPCRRTRTWCRHASSSLAAPPRRTSLRLSYDFEAVSGALVGLTMPNKSRRRVASGVFGSNIQIKIYVSSATRARVKSARWEVSRGAGGQSEPFSLQREAGQVSQRALWSSSTVSGPPVALYGEVRPGAGFRAPSFEGLGVPYRYPL